MAKISNTTVYPNIVPTAEDFVVLTDVSDSDATKTCTIDSLQEYFGTKILVRTLKYTEILNSGTTPIVLATCNTGEYIQVMRSSFFLNFNTTAYVSSVSSGLLLTNNGSPTYIVGVLPKVSFESLIDVAGSFSGNAGAYTYPLSGGGNSLTCQSFAANPTLGDSDITINIQYRIAKFT
tara:strand:- start:1642 stop:2175 length:534 start_codon:yes stop_codon:yes gene_type:complete